MAAAERVQALVDALQADPDDADTALVYADELAGRGDPRGELIVLQHRAESAHGAELEGIEAAAEAHLATHGGALLGPLAGAGASVAWRRGFAARIELDAPSVATVAAVLAHESARFVRELAIESVSCATAAAIVELPEIDELRRLDISLDDSWLECARVVDALAARPRPRLAALTLGADHIDERSKEGSLFLAWDRQPLVRAASIAALAEATPALHELELRGLYMFEGLVHPELRRLTLVGDAVNGCPFDYLEGRVALPRLERLEQSLLIDEYRWAVVFRLALTPAQVPSLRELAIHGRYDPDHSQGTLFEFLAGAQLLPQLTSLTIADLRADLDEPNLDSFARRFLHLERFHVDKLVIEDEDGEDVAAATREAFEARCRNMLPNLTFDRCGPLR